MKKVIKLTESDIEKLVKIVLSEQDKQGENNKKMMIDAWKKIVEPTLKSEGWQKGHGDYRMVKKHPFDKWFVHCVCIPPTSGGDGWFTVYRVEKEFDAPTMKQTIDFNPPKCGSIEECAKRALNAALENVK